MHMLLSDQTEFAERLIKELKDTSKEVQQMNEEMTKKDKQVRFSFKLNLKNEKGLKDAIEKIDSLEMDNYMLRELVAELTRHFEDYEIVISDLVSCLNGEPMTPERVQTV